MGHWTNSTSQALSATSGEITTIDFDVEIHPGSQIALRNGIYDYAYHVNLINTKGQVGPSRATSALVVRRDAGRIDIINESRSFCEIDSGAEGVLSHTGRTPLSEGDEVTVKVNLDNITQAHALDARTKQRQCSLTLDLVGGGAASGNFAGTTFPPSAIAGQRHYHTGLNESFEFNGEKWLGDLRSDGGGRSGSQTANTYFRRYNGQLMSATLGIYIPYDATIVGLSWTKATIDAGNIGIHRNGVSLVDVNADSNGGGVDLDIDFDANGVLALYWNSLNTTANVQIAIHYRRRFTPIGGGVPFGR